MVSDSINMYDAIRQKAYVGGMLAVSTEMVIMPAIKFARMK